MDTSVLGLGEKIAAGAGLVLLIAMFFLGWFSLEGISAQSDDGADTITLNADEVEALADESGEDTSANAWQAFSAMDILLVLAALAGLGVAGATAMGNALPAPAAAVVAGLGGLATLLLLFRLISPPDLIPDDVPASVDLTVEVGRGIGIFVGLIASAALAYGGFRMMGENETAGDSASPRV